MKPITRLPAAFILCLSLISGCTTSFVYNRLDSLITWYVDDYVDLTSTQQSLLQQELQPALQWHRQEELQKNIALLDTMLSDVSKPVKVDEVAAWTDELMQSFRRVQLNMVDVALKFSSSLSDEQMQEFIDNVWDKHEERKDEYLSRTNEEYIEDSYDSLEGRLSEYLGRLSDEQQALLQQAAGSLQRLDYAWLEDRDDWLKRIQPYLQRSPGWQDEIRQLFADRESYRSETYQQVFAHNLAIVNQAVTDVLNMRDDRQQKILLAELSEFKSEIQNLIAYRQNTFNQTRPKTL